MCGVLGIYGYVEEELVRKLLLETKIRGRHATGVSFWKDKEVHTIKEPLPAEEFLEIHDVRDWFEGDKITMIAHCRYSTSDLDYNQPISDNTRSLVHNGVISQVPSEQWYELYGVECEGKNDSELLFRTGVQNWPDASIAAVFLDGPKMTWYRNGKRPLWESIDEEKVIITSTEDIAKRAGILYAKRVESSAGRDLQNIPWSVAGTV